MRADVVRGDDAEVATPAPAACPEEVALAAGVVRAADPLPSWNEGPAKARIAGFCMVEFVPLRDRMKTAAFTAARIAANVIGRLRKSGD